MSENSQWKLFGWEVSKSLIVFSFQVVLVYLVVVTSLYNISFQKNKDKELWISLLSSGVGYLLPNPTLRDV